MRVSRGTFGLVLPEDEEAFTKDQELRIITPMGIEPQKMLFHQEKEAQLIDFYRTVRSMNDQSEDLDLLKRFEQTLPFVTTQLATLNKRIDFALTSCGNQGFVTIEALSN